MFKADMRQKKNHNTTPLSPVKSKIIKLISIGFCIALFFAYVYNLKRQSSVGFLANNQHTSDFTNNNPYQQDISWTKYKTYGYYISSPVIKNNILYVGELYGNALKAISVNTGKLLWSFTAEDDVPFVPAVTDTTAYVTSSDGRLYAINTSSGKKRWEYRVKDFYAMATSPTYFHNTIFFGSRDTFLYAVNATNGKERWKFKTGGGIDTTPVISGNMLYVGSFDGNFYAIDIRTGKECWKFKTQGKIIGTAAEKNGAVYFGSADSYVYSLDGSTGRLLWKITLKDPIKTSPTIFRNELYIASNNMLYAVNLRKHSVTWKKSIPTDGYTGVAIKNNMLYVGSKNGFLYALAADDGKEVWKFHTDASITASPSIVGNTVFVTNRDGSLYAVNRNTGHPFTETDFRITVGSTKPLVNEVYELTIYHDSGGYQYPWLDASVSATFRHKSLTMNVAGFYYDKNTWKIRFTPPESGQWLWEITLSAYSNVTNTKTNNFVVTPSNHDGFIMLNSHNENRLELPGGKLFHPLGIQTCINDSGDDDGFYLNSLFIDTKTVDLDSYLKTYGKNGAGFNMFRWGAENCTFRLWYFNADPRAPQRFLDREGIWADMLMKKLKENGFHIWFSIFNTGPVSTETKPAVMMKDIHVLDPYLEYVVARYGAYVDVWELLNESGATDEWVSYVVNYIHAIDPYHHLITINWQKPKLPGIDITSPHWYQTDPLSVADLAISEIISQNKFGKPTVFGEVGNQGYNWDPNSFIQMRVRIWTAFFEEAGIIFWDESDVKDHFNKDHANLYFGAEERTAVKTFQYFIKQITHNIHQLSIRSTNPAVRVYAAKTPSAYYGYVYHYLNPDEQITTTVLLPYTEWVDPVVTWIDPSKGTVLAKEKLTNYGALISPSFSSDAAFSITENGTNQ
jgi:outer membrane protein assembly factor BamB